MTYGSALFKTTIKHEDVKAIDEANFEGKVVEGAKELYWFIAVRNKSYKEEFYIFELLNAIKSLSKIEQTLLVKTYGLDGNDRISINKAYESENLQAKKAQILFARIFKKLKILSV